MEWVIPLPHPKIPKGLNLNDREHWAVTARATQIIRGHVAREAKKQNIPRLGRVRVALIVYRGTKHKLDAENPVPVLKAACDGLCSDSPPTAGVTPDDSPKWVKKMMPIIHYRKDNPGMVLVVTDITGELDETVELAEKYG